MTQRRVVVFCFGCILFLQHAALAQKDRIQPDLKQAMRRVDQHYNRLQSLKENFVESYEGTGLVRTESGVLWLKKPGKMRWEYSQPQKKVFISDGKNLYFYVSGEAQARESNLKNADDLRSPLRYLLGKTKLEKELSGIAMRQSNENAGDSIITGVPRAMRESVRSVDIEINQQNQIVRLQIFGVDGSRTEFNFSHIVENAPAADDLFRFEVPAGVELLRNQSFQP